MTILIIVVAAAIVITLALCLAIANFAGESYYEKFLAMNEILVEENMTAAEFFNYINSKYFNGKVEVVLNPTNGGDAYSRGSLFLSPSTVANDSLASFSIIAHEMGHALQDKNSNILKKLKFLRRLGYLVGAFMFPMLIVGLILMIVGGRLTYFGIGFAGGGILIFLLAIIIKAFTIKIEKGASQNAVVFLKEVLSEKEVKQCKKFLNDARLTYWADMFRALLGWTMLTRGSNLFGR